MVIDGEGFFSGVVIKTKQMFVAKRRKTRAGGKLGGFLGITGVIKKGLVIFSGLGVFFRKFHG